MPLTAVRLGARVPSIDIYYSSFSGWGDLFDGCQSRGNNAVNRRQIKYRSFGVGGVSFLKAASRGKSGVNRHHKYYYSSSFSVSVSTGR